MSQTWFYLSCLKNEFSKRLNKNPHYSLRAYARDLEVAPSTLSRILNNKKIPTPDLTFKFLIKLSLSPQLQKQFKRSMAQAYEAKGVLRKRKEIKEILKSEHSINTERDLTPEIFKVISDWYHYAILQLIETESFQNNPKWIGQQLGVNETEVKIAIQRLKELELIIEKNGTLERTVNRLNTGELLITTAALRKRIKQISSKSVQSLEKDPITLRNHTTMTMAIDPIKINIAKSMIQDFMDKLSFVLETKKKQVYELQINLFPLQRSQS